MMNVLDTITSALAKGSTRFAFELLPPLKGDGTRSVFAAVDNVVEFDPAYINVTFHRETFKQSLREDGVSEWHAVRRRPGTVGISAAIQNRYYIPTVPHLICGGLSRYDIEDSLIDMDFLGLHNVLALRGDALKTEERFTPHAQGHSHAVDLVRQIAAMNRGEFVDGEVERCHHSRFSIGVAGYPETHADALSAEDDIARLKEKVDAGAEYIVTQLFFDNRCFFDFVERCRRAGIEVPIIPGLKPLASPEHLEILPRTFHCSIPDELRRAVDDCRGDRAKCKEVGIEWTIAQARALKAAHVPVIHFYTMSRTENIARIAKQVF